MEIDICFDDVYDGWEILSARLQRKSIRAWKNWHINRIHEMDEMVERHMENRYDVLFNE